MLRTLRARAAGFFFAAPLTIAFIAMFLFFAIWGEGFVATDNLGNVALQSAALLIIAIAVGFLMIAGYIDLSVGSIVGFSGVAAGYLMTQLHWHPLWASVAGVALGAGAGLITGFLVAYLRFSALIVTLGMLITLRGLQNGISGGQTYFGLPPSMLYLGTAEWFGLPASVWVSLLLFGIGMFALGYTRFGRSLYAIGGNSAAAKAAGIRVGQVVWLTLIIGSLLAALAGLMLAGRLGSVAENSGNGWIFTVFAGAVIGGISMNGGKGTIFGAFTGILLLFVVQNVLTLAGISADWINFLNGSIILAALVVSRIASGQAQTT